MRFRNTAHLVTALLVCLVCALVVPSLQAGPGSMNSYVGVLGDEIDYRTGTLRFSETDLVLPGRHGLDLVIQRSYSSDIFQVWTVDSAATCEYDSSRTRSEFSGSPYLGCGWHIEYPFLASSGDSTLIVYQDGSVEVPFFNMDYRTYTPYPLKTMGQNLLTDYGVDSSVADTMLLTNGTKWVFGHCRPDRKYLTHMINRFGDTLEIEYHANSRWMKKITSPIGLEVRFQYVTGGTPYDYNTVPPEADSVRLYKINYDNHVGDTLELTYGHSTLFTDSLFLTQVSYPTGDTLGYGYTNDVYYDTLADFETVDLDYYDPPANFLAINGRLLSNYRGIAGAEVQFKYRYANLPLYTPCDGDQHAGENFEDDYQFRGHIGVNMRIADSDTVLFKREMLHCVLTNPSPDRSGDTLHITYPSSVPIRTTVEIPGKGREEYWYVFEFDCEYRPDIDPSYYLTWGVFPGKLQRVQTIYGDTLHADTTTSALDYGIPSSKISIGEKEVIWVEIVGEDTTEYCDTIDVYIPARLQTHVGAYFYSPEDYLSGPAWPVEQRRYSAMTRLCSDGRVTITNISGETDYPDGPWDDGWVDFGSLCPWGLDSIDICGPDPTNGDTLSYTIDSLLDYDYIASLNMIMPTKKWQLVKNDTFVVAGFVEIEYDSTKGYLPIKTTKYLDTAWAEDTTTYVSELAYDSDFHLYRTISSANDTLYHEYDTIHNAFLWKTVDSSFGSNDETIASAKEHYPNGKIKYSINIYGDTTAFYYDQYGRDSLVSNPFADTASLLLWDIDNHSLTKKVPLDSGLWAVAAVDFDDYFRVIQSALEVNDSVDVIDTTVYNNDGTVQTTARARYTTDTTGWIWTEFGYDEMGRWIATILPNGDTASYVDLDSLTAYSSDVVSLRGIRLRTIRDHFGHVIQAEITDTSGSIDTVSAMYDARGNVLSSIDFEGLERTAEYDDWGRLIKSSHPDVGDKRLWYDRRGRIRFVKSNSDSEHVYIKYDSEGRVAEEGTINNPDTTKVDTIGYPGTSDTCTVRVKYVHDYYDSTAAVDTTSGLNYSIGKLTELWEFNVDGDTTGFTFYYYNRMGKVRQKTTWIVGLLEAQKLWFEYYLSGNVKKVVYPDSSFTEYSFDQIGRIDSISGIIGHGDIEFEAWGAIKQIDFVNDMHSKFEYDSLGRPVEILKYTDTANMELYCRGFEYNKGFIDIEWDLDYQGNITTDSIVRSYEYDALGRLDSAFMRDPNGSATDQSMRYRYDNNNNLDLRFMVGSDSIAFLRFDSTNRDSIIYFYACPDDTCDDLDSTYRYHYNDRGLTDTLSVCLGSNSNYNRRTIYQYDYRNLLTMVEFQKANYNGEDGPDTVINLYNASGQKVKQTHIYQSSRYVPGPGGTLDTLPDQRGPGGDSVWIWIRMCTSDWYVWSGGKIVLRFNNDHDDITEIDVYGLGQRLATRLPGKSIEPDSVQFYVNDIQGTVHARIRRDGVPMMGRTEYFPYGQVYSTSGTGSEYSFIGKEEDNTEMHDFGPRYYSAQLGRFQAPDPILSGASPYSYADGNPVMRYDPTGLASIEPKGWYDLTYEQQQAALDADMAALSRWGEMDRQAEAEAEAIGNETAYYDPHSGLCEGVYDGWGREKNRNSWINDIDLIPGAKDHGRTYIATFNIVCAKPKPKPPTPLKVIAALARMAVGNGPIPDLFFVCSDDGTVLYMLYGGKSSFDNSDVVDGQDYWGEEGVDEDSGISEGRQGEQGGDWSAGLAFYYGGGVEVALISENGMLYFQSGGGVGFAAGVKGGWLPSVGGNLEGHTETGFGLKTTACMGYGATSTWDYSSGQWSTSHQYMVGGQVTQAAVYTWRIF